MKSCIKYSKCFTASNGVYFYRYYNDGSKEKVFIPRRDETYPCVTVKANS